MNAASPESTWELAHDAPRVDEAHVEVWRIDLRAESELRSVTAYAALLSPEERARAERFLRKVHADRFTITRGVLRCLLGACLDRDPKFVSLGYGEHGKPSLTEFDLSSGVTFNVAHSNDLATIALARGRLLGVDVEWIRHDLDHAQLAARFFAPGEVAALEALPAEQRVQAFFECWARKEAYVKAIGKGLAIPLDQFEVTLAPDRPARILRASPDELRRWSMCALAPNAGYTGALVVEGDGWTPRWRSFCGRW